MEQSCTISFCINQTNAMTGTVHQCWLMYKVSAIYQKTITEDWTKWQIFNITFDTYIIYQWIKQQSSNLKKSWTTTMFEHWLQIVCQFWELTNNSTVAFSIIQSDKSGNSCHNCWEFYTTHNYKSLKISLQNYYLMTNAKWQQVTANSVRYTNAGSKAVKASELGFIMLWPANSEWCYNTICAIKLKDLRLLLLGG